MKRDNCAAFLPEEGREGGRDAAVLHGEADRLTDATYRGLRTLSMSQGLSRGMHVLLDVPTPRESGRRLVPLSARAA